MSEHFLSALWPPGGFVEWVLFHQASFRMGLARPLSQLLSKSQPTPYRALRRHCKGRPMQAHHGISILHAACNLAFPVPGRLAGNQPIQYVVIARLAGITALLSQQAALLPLASTAWNASCMFTRLALQLILVKGFKLYSFQLPDTMCPVLLFIVTTSPCQDWVICAPAAFLGCGSRFSGSLSGIEP